MENKSLKKKELKKYYGRNHNNKGIILYVAYWTSTHRSISRSQFKKDYCHTHNHLNGINKNLLSKKSTEFGQISMKITVWFSILPIKCLDVLNVLWSGAKGDGPRSNVQTT